MYNADNARGNRAVEEESYLGFPHWSPEYV